MKKKTTKILTSALSLAAMASLTFGITYIVGSATNYVVQPQLGTDIPPTITIQTEGYDLENVPQATRNLPYRIFSATALDIEGNTLSVKTSVYLHYNTDTKVNVGDYCDSFTPQYYGIYTVEYSAQDDNGNVALLTYDIVCAEKEAFAPVVDVEEQTTVVGTVTQVKEISFENISGNAEYEITATHKNSETSYAVENGSFTPMVVGEYLISYACSDYVETKTVSYVLQVTENDEILFYDELSVNEYFIVDAEYQLPALNAYHFATGSASRIACQITVASEDGSIQKLGADRKFTPTKEEDLVITYEARYGDKTVSKTLKSRAIDVNLLGNMDMRKYLQTQEGTISATSQYIAVSTGKNCSVDFINPLLAEQCNLEFSFNQAKNNFTQLHVYLTDSLDKSLQVKLSYIKQSEEKAEFRINDKYVGKAGLPFSTTDIIRTSYEQKTRTASFARSSDCEIKTTLAGAEFDGFPSGYVNVTFELGGVIGESELRVNKMGNQTLSSLAGDGAPPMVVFSMYSKGDHVIGDMISVDPVCISDVLTCSGENIVYYVKAPNGQYVTSTEGEILDQDTDPTKSYSFIANENGGYIVYIRAEDMFGNSAVYSYTIWVTDQEAPVFHGVVEYMEVKVGDTVKIPKLQVSDNVSQEMQIYVYCTDGLEMQLIEEAFVAQRIGMYTLTYYVTDDAGNVTMATTTIKVLED